jgi:NADH dehydrogenase
MRRDVHAITGAFGYSGRHLAQVLLERGVRVRTLTGHPDRPDPFGGRVEVRPLPFGDPAALRAELADVRVLYDTYWIRFERGASTFARAVENGRALLRAAAESGVERIVHVSITNPSLDSPLPYFRGKAEVEETLRGLGVSHAILRPAVFFGGRDVLVNNIAWLLRRLPLFGVVPGAYGLRPIHVDDFARLAASLGEGREDAVVDAVGPETLRYDALVRTVARAVRSRAAIVPVPRALLLLASRIVGRFIGDVPITRDEVSGLTAGLLVTSGPATGSTRFTEWVAEHGEALGREWASEVGRHFASSSR